MKILYFFQFLWLSFALLHPDPEPATQINADPGTDPDPDPDLDLKPWKLEYRTCLDSRLGNWDFSDSPVATCLLKIWEEKIWTPSPFYVFCTFFHSLKYFLVNFWLKQPKLVGDFIFMVSLLLLASPVLRRPNPKENMVLELTIISPYVHFRVDSQHIYHGQPYATVDLIPMP